MKTTNNKSRKLVEKQEDFKASNLSGVTLGNKYIVYSYDCYPLLVYVDNKWFENGENYSQSTSRQLNQCRPTIKTVVISHASMKDLI